MRFFGCVVVDDVGSSSEASGAGGAAVDFGGSDAVEERGVGRWGAVSEGEPAGRGGLECFFGIVGGGRGL